MTMNEKGVKFFGIKGIRGAAVALSFAAFAGCGAGAVPEGTDTEEVAADEEEVGSTGQAALASCASGALGSPINTHVCTHPSIGPFASRQARTTAPFQTLQPIHYYQTITFQDTTAPYVGTVKFTAAATDDHVIYYNPSNVSVSVSVGGVPVADDPAINPDPGTISCTGLSRYRVFPMTAGSTYDITFTSPTSNTIHTALEAAAPYKVKYYQDSDGDGWGKSAVFVQTTCVPPAGYVTKGLDCNDANNLIYPGRTPEICGDGIDSNCNGNDCT